VCCRMDLGNSSIIHRVSCARLAGVRCVCVAYCFTLLPRDAAIGRRSVFSKKIPHTQTKSHTTGKEKCRSQHRPHTGGAANSAAFCFAAHRSRQHATPTHPHDLYYIYIIHMSYIMICVYNMCYIYVSSLRQAQGVREPRRD